MHFEVSAVHRILSAIRYQTKKTLVFPFKWTLHADCFSNFNISRELSLLPAYNSQIDAYNLVRPTRIMIDVADGGGERISYIFHLLCGPAILLEFSNGLNRIAQTHTYVHKEKINSLV